MDCEGVRAAMYPASDNELDGDLLVSFQQHLTFCSGCAHHFVYVTKLLTIVRVRCCRHAAPATLRIRILASFPHRGDAGIGRLD